MLGMANFDSNVVNLAEFGAEGMLVCARDAGNKLLKRRSGCAVAGCGAEGRNTK